MEDEIKSLVESLGLRSINFLVSNLDGRIFNMEENAANLDKYFKYGFGIDGSSVPGYATIEKSDVILRPDPSTFCVLELEGHPFALMFCDVLSDSGKGEFHPGDPRGVLNFAIKEIEKEGFSPHMMSELEFITLDKKTNKAIDNGSYMALPPEDRGHKFRQELLEMMLAAHMNIKRLHHENAPGQQEVEMEITDAKKNADDSLLGIWLTQLISDYNGWYSTFTPKPLGPDEAGNGLHMHMLLKSVETGENVFKGKEGEKLSMRCKQFIAGVLKYSSEITAVFARSEESYSRLKPGHEAPTRIAWGYANRSALVRVPKISEGNEDTTRIEFRAGDASGSPHLLAALILYAGLKGIREKLEPVDPVTFNLDALSEEDLKKMNINSLPDSTKVGNSIIKESAFLKELLSDHVIKYLTS